MRIRDWLLFAVLAPVLVPLFLLMALYVHYREEWQGKVLK